MQNSTKGLPWQEVAAILKKQGILHVDTNEWQYGTYYLCCFRKGAYITPPGVTHDLIISFNVTVEISDRVPSRRLITETKVELVVSVLGPAKFLNEKRYPEGTVVLQSLQLPEVGEAAKKYPVLEEIRVEYRFLFDRWAEYSPHGFHVSLSFVDNAKKSTAGQRISINVASELDPLENWKGEKQLNGFFSRDSLLDPRAMGGSSWKSGWGRGHHKLERVDGIPPRKDDDELSKPIGKISVVYSPADVVVLPRDIRSLKVEDTRLGRATVDAIAEHPSLQFLDIQWRELDDACLKQIATIPKLTKLSINGEKVTDNGLAHLTKLAGLTYLSLWDSRQISDVGCSSLRDLKNLKSLSLGWSEQISEAGLKQLAELKDLRSFDIGGERLTDEGLAQIAKLSNLEDLSFGHTHRVRASGISRLAGLRKLRRLQIAHASVDDASLSELAKLVNLEHLEFHGLPITDRGLAPLARLTKLHYFYITECEKITDTGLAALQAKLPGQYERK